MDRRWAWVSIAAIFLLALVLRLYPLEQYHGWDESTYLQHAEYVAYGKGNFNEFSFRPPVLPFLLGCGMLLWHSAYGASIIVALLSACIALGLFLACRKAHSDEAGLFAALLVAVHPAYVQYGHLILTDAIVASFLAFALWLALDNRWHWVLFGGVACGIAGLTKFTALVAVAALGLLVLWRDWQLRDERKQTGIFRLTYTASFVVGWLVIIGTYLIWMKTTRGSFFAAFNAAQALMWDTYGSVHAYEGIIVWTIPLLTGLALFAWFVIRKWKRLRATQPLLVPFTVTCLLWFIIIFSYLLRLTVKDTRYILPALVPLLALAGIGLAMLVQAARKHKSLLSLVIVIIVLALSIGSFARLNGPPVDRFVPPAVDIALHINSDNNISRAVYTTTDYPVFGYYTNNKVAVVDGPRFLNAYPRNMGRDGYLVVKKDALREPTVGWADSQAALARVYENDAYVLYYYTRSLAK